MTIALTGVLRAVVADIVNAALEMLTDNSLQTPQPSQIPRLAELWEISWQVAVGLYGLVILVGAVIVMAHQSVQTHYGLREIAPRLVVGFFAGWLTLPLADMAVQLANAVSDALLGPPDVGGGLRGLAQLTYSALFDSAMVAGPIGSAWVVLLFGLALCAGLIALLFGYIVRVIATILLVAAAPLVVMWHALPQTDPIARWWWRALGGVLAIQIVQALVLSIAGAILLAGADEGFPVFGLGGSGWVTLLVLAALVWVLVKIPGWMWSAIRLGGGGRRSLLGKAVRAAIVWKTGGLLRGALAATTGGGSRSRGSATSGGGRGDADDPYARTPEFAGGQLGLPFTGLRRRVPARTAPATTAGTASGSGSSGGGRARGGVQLALPLGEDWPENRPVAGRDGQWRLPISADRLTRPDTRRSGFAPPAPVEPASGPGRGQLRFPTSGRWPEHQPVAGRDGQYRLPIPVTRRPRPATPTPPSPAPSSTASPPPATTRQAARARQLSFDDLDPFRGNRPLAGGQYPLPLPGMTRHPRPADRPRPGPPAPPAAVRPGTGQTRLPIPAPPPRATPPRPAPPRRAAPRVRPTSPPTPRPAPPPTSPPPTSPPSPSRGRRRGPGRRPGQENPS